MEKKIEAAILDFLRLEQIHCPLNTGGDPAIHVVDVYWEHDEEEDAEDFPRISISNLARHIAEEIQR